MSRPSVSKEVGMLKRAAAEHANRTEKDVKSSVNKQ